MCFLSVCVCVCVCVLWNVLFLCSVLHAFSLFTSLCTVLCWRERSCATNAYSHMELGPVELFRSPHFWGTLFQSPTLTAHSMLASFYWRKNKQILNWLNHLILNADPDLQEQWSQTTGQVLVCGSFGTWPKRKNTLVILFLLYWITLWKLFYFKKQILF